jgi:sortase A
MIYSTEQGTSANRNLRFMLWIRCILLTAGVLALSYVTFTLIDAWLYQKRAMMTLEKQIYAEEQHRSGLPKIVAKEGDVLGRMEIPRLKLSVAILQGTTPQTLRLGAGHIDGTAFPGEIGDIGIAGHRDTFFRALKDIRRDDEIQLQSASGIALYAVDWIQITAPDDGSIVSSATQSAITLVTCYPFHYIGAAPERYVVHARRK